MPTPRRCRTHRGTFTPPRFRPWQRECEPCRGHFFAPERADREPSRSGALHTYLPGLLDDATAVRSQASVIRERRIDPSKFSDDDLYAIRDRDLPGKAGRDALVVTVNRRRALDALATPNLAALLAAIEPEGETP